MGDFFKTVTSGLGRYVFAWLLPTALTMGVLLVFVYPSVGTGTLLVKTVNRARTGIIPAPVALGFVVVALAVVSGYLSTGLYRILEGYRLPKSIACPLRKRHLREWHRLYGPAAARRAQDRSSGALVQARWRYPERVGDVMPTKLGNALKGLETYGRNRWNLDVLLVWHELVSVAPEALARELDDARSAMDFFLSAIVHLQLLAITCFLVVPWSTDSVPLIVGLICVAAIWPSYLAAVSRVDDYRSAVQALANLGRVDLAKSLGFRLPNRLDRERFFWANLTRYVRDGEELRGTRVDRYRSNSPPLSGEVGQGVGPATAGP